MRHKIWKSFALIIISILIICGFWWFSHSNQAIDDRAKLVIGTDPGFKPFEYRVGDKIVGFDIDLAQEIAKDLNRRLVVEEMNFDGLIAALQTGKIDIVAAGMSVTEDRSKSVNFSSSYYLASQMIIVKKDNQSIRNKDDLIGKKIGVQLGTTGDTMVNQITDVQKIQFSVVPAVLQELRSGRIDAAVLDNAPADMYVKTTSDLKMLDAKLSEEYYALALRKEDNDLLASVNSTIERVKKDGTYERLIEKHFSVQLSQRMGLVEIFLGDQRYMYLVRGLGVTLLLALAATLIGVFIGLIIALMRISRWQPLRFLKKTSIKGLAGLSNWNPLEWIARVYTDVLRGTPVLVQLLIMYYVVFGSYQNMSKILIAALAFGINSGAYVAELIRAGFESLPRGQWEAAQSLGLSYIQTIWYVTMPQALKVALPSLISEFITLLKETSIVGWIGATDLMRGADNIRFQTATAFESLVAAALIYLLLTTVFTRLMRRVERKMKNA
ncbi:MAG: ABC transporter permease subunit [Candidatus Saccharibacteria bacterium]|nr:ABC transporter permease subunit [Candidatus Saccharibacteria bacterium]